MKQKLNDNGKLKKIPITTIEIVSNRITVKVKAWTVTRISDMKSYETENFFLKQT